VPEFPVLIENSRHPALKIPHGEELPCFFFIYCLNHRIRCKSLDKRRRDEYNQSLPRQARLDAPGARHHIMVRGIDKTVIFRDDRDKIKFLEKTGAAVTGEK
jgi:N12 class adenine-specific DNA methylase